MNTTECQRFAIDFVNLLLKTHLLSLTYCDCGSVLIGYRFDNQEPHRVGMDVKLFKELKHKYNIKSYVCVDGKLYCKACAEKRQAEKRQSESSQRHIWAIPQ